MTATELFRGGVSVYCVGIKGTGVCALAELMHDAGMKVSGSDTGEIFYTDAILKKLQIPYYENFDEVHISSDIALVIHSAAYNAETNSEIAKALRLKIPVLKYTDALGAWSSNFDSCGICGVHGKTTTTAMTGILMRAAGIPAQILSGGAARDFGGRSTLSLGSKYFVAETCEYREHFLSFNPKRLILTSVESDHQDYYPTYESIRDAFARYCRLIPADGELIYCADNQGAGEIARIAENENRGIKLIPYGYKADGAYRISSYKTGNEKAFFTLSGVDVEFTLRVPGEHQAQNAAAAIALTSVLAQKEKIILDNEKIQSVKEAFENFKGSKRRSEILGEAAGILFMDDYGHHPTAIKTTLAGIKKFYPERRLVVSFMSHTYTRTSALLDDFASSFNAADFVILHKIYGSAREKYSGGVNGETLFEKVRLIRGPQACCYIEEPDASFDALLEILKPGDLFITVGAGNNWTLGERLFKHFGENKK
ncbi:MAG: UDP-N-acetylmuramate--L-alanine ligase [Treponema sp.]|jgi:UDP-N-acetylmuramate--alanine ligase|nr:UDP-N-acetylmuramate--L-alanine ligase [Treponema sp.]